MWWGFTTARGGDPLARMSAFKTYDIRGRLGTDLTETIAHRIARAFAAVTLADAVVLARDCRESSPALADAVAAGLVTASVVAGLAGLALWSVAGPWSFPDALPQGLTLRTWAQAAPAGMLHHVAEIRPVEEKPGGLDHPNERLVQLPEFDAGQEEFLEGLASFHLRLLDPLEGFFLQVGAKAQVGDFDEAAGVLDGCLLYTSPSPRDRTRSRMPSSA